jgi:predicted transcriptional regulator YheO
MQNQDIVDAVIQEIQNRENARIEAEKQEILANLDEFGI